MGKEKPAEYVSHPQFLVLQPSSSCLQLGTHHPVQGPRSTKHEEGVAYLQHVCPGMLILQPEGFVTVQSLLTVTGLHCVFIWDPSMFFFFLCLFLGSMLCCRMNVCNFTSTR